MNINSIRFGGIASGLDTESIVSQMMRIERLKVDRQLQEKQVLQWKRNDYRQINTQLLSLRNASFDLRLQGTFLQRSATSSNDAAFTATASSNAIEGNYSLKVTQLAEGVRMNSSAELGSNENKSTLEKQFEGIGAEVSFTLKGQGGEKTFSFESNKHSIYDVVREINNAGLGIRANYDASLDRFFLVNNTTGTEAHISILTDDGGGDGKAFLRDFLKILTSEGRGKNAKVVFEGIDAEYQSNSFSVLGINFTLKDAPLDKEFTVTVSNNIDKIVDTFKSFIEKYNTIMENINTKLREEKQRAFPPLSDEQKESMSEKDIEKWEEKARSGLFRADPILSSAITSIRLAAMDSVQGISGDNKMLSAIGISTAQWFDQGKLYLDENKLRNALSEDLEGVMQLFTQAEEKDGQTIVKGAGIARKLYNSIDHAMKQIIDKAGNEASLTDQSFMGKAIQQVDKTIIAMESRLMRTEENLWRRFAAMEKALSQMQNQGNWFNQQMQGMQQ